MDNQGGFAKRLTRFGLEFVTIVFGVLVALWADQAAQRSAERATELRYIDRLVSELAQDTLNHATWLGYLRDKELALLRLSEFLQGGGRPEDPSSLVRDLATGTNFAWNAGPLALSMTFDEMRSSGTLNLIEDEEIRLSVVAYYFSAVDRERRAAPRTTEYPDISYRLFRRGPDANELDYEEGMTALELNQVVDALARSDAFPHVTAEINRGRFVTLQFTELRAEAMQLIRDLEEYRARQ